MNYTKLTEFNGTPVVEFSAGGYTAMAAFELGSNIIRLHDDKNGIEFFRFKKENPAEVIDGGGGDGLVFAELVNGGTGNVMVFDQCIGGFPGRA
mgnify:CR=1 FL=1